MRALLGCLSLIFGAALVYFSIGVFRTALRDYEDKPDGLVVGYGLMLVILGVALLWSGWRALRR